MTPESALKPQTTVANACFSFFNDHIWPSPLGSLRGGGGVGEGGESDRMWADGLPESRPGETAGQEGTVPWVPFQPLEPRSPL